jgi:hypothetical protein
MRRKDGHTLLIVISREKWSPPLEIGPMLSQFGPVQVGSLCFPKDLDKEGQ